MQCDNQLWDHNASKERLKKKTEHWLNVSLALTSFFGKTTKRAVRKKPETAQRPVGVFSVFPQVPTLRTFLPRQVTGSGTLLFFFFLICSGKLISIELTLVGACHLKHEAVEDGSQRSVTRQLQTQKSSWQWTASAECPGKLFQLRRRNTCKALFS